MNFKKQLSRLQTKGLCSAVAVILAMSLPLTAFASSGFSGTHGANALTAVTGSGERGDSSMVPAAKPKHVIYIIADNIHLEDIKKMPHLMDFLNNGTLFDQDHTIVDTHTQDGMLSDMTGQYPDKTGVPDQSFYANGQKSYFLYWTSPDHDGKPHVTTTPPWTVFNQHGFNVGAVAAPDMELEGKQEVTAAMMNNATGDKNPYDYLGVSVHKADGSVIHGAPNLPYIYHAASWSDPTAELGGFPGWGKGIADAVYPLEATYLMQTNGVPVTFTYLHDVHEVNGKQAASGQYDSVLAQYDAVFQTFFAKLNEAGINKSNTLFVLTTDEGDHFMPKGEYSGNILPYFTNNPVYSTDSSKMNVVSDSGALFYLKNGANLNGTLASLQAVPDWNYAADPAELNALHVTAAQAPTRTPSFILFGKPDVWYNTSGSGTFDYNPHYLWNHGTISSDIDTTWLGMAGPGIRSHNISHEWLDHADTMPTIYQAMGFDLRQSGFDGVPAVDAFIPSSLPKAVAQNTEDVRQATEMFKQLNAPLGRFGLTTLKLASKPYEKPAGNPYRSVKAVTDQAKSMDKTIELLTAARDKIAGSLQQELLTAWENGKEGSKWTGSSHQGGALLNALNMRDKSPRHDWSQPNNK